MVVPGRRRLSAGARSSNGRSECTAINLTDHFLIAMPDMADPNFSRTLTFICEHNEQGALGLVVNRPIDMTLAALFEQLELELADARARRDRRSSSAARCRPTAASCCTGRSASGSSTLPVGERSGSPPRATSSRRWRAARARRGCW